MPRSPQLLKVHVRVGLDEPPHPAELDVVHDPEDAVLLVFPPHHPRVVLGALEHLEQPVSDLDGLSGGVGDLKLEPSCHSCGLKPRVPSCGVGGGGGRRPRAAGRARVLTTCTWLHMAFTWPALVHAANVHKCSLVPAQGPPLLSFTKLSKKKHTT